MKVLIFFFFSSYDSTNYLNFKYTAVYLRYIHVEKMHATQR